MASAALGLVGPQPARGRGALDGPAPPPSPAWLKDLQQAHAHLGQGDYLKAVQTLERALHVEGVEDPAHPLHQLRAEISSFMTGGLGSADLPAGASWSMPQAEATLLADADLVEALPTIQRLAAGTQVVILNEEHHTPRHRAFALEVARNLRDLGYSYLALEALAHPADADEAERRIRRLATSGAPSLADGFYVRDPVYADFLRQALALRYEPIAYEETTPLAGSDPHARMNAREQAQAEALVRKIFAHDPAAKVLIHVGPSHLLERRLGTVEWMAARLRALTGIDPLTVDQTTISTTAPESAGRVRHAALAPRVSGSSMTMMGREGPQRVGATAQAVDLQIVHPEARLHRGRPDWLWAMGRRPLEMTFMPATRPRLLQAYVIGAASDAVPLDQVLIPAGVDRATLAVSEGPVTTHLRHGLDADPGSP